MGPPHKVKPLPKAGVSTSASLLHACTLLLACACVPAALSAPPPSYFPDVAFACDWAAGVFFASPDTRGEYELSCNESTWNAIRDRFLSTASQPSGPRLRTFTIGTPSTPNMSVALTAAAHAWASGDAALLDLSRGGAVLSAPLTFTAGAPVVVAGGNITCAYPRVDVPPKGPFDADRDTMIVIESGAAVAFADVAIVGCTISVGGGAAVSLLRASLVGGRWGDTPLSRIPLDADGGCLRAAGGHVLAVSSHFVDCRAGVGGGARLTVAATLRAVESVFTRPAAVKEGGGIATDDYAGVLLEGVTVTNASCGFGKGGGFLYLDGFTISHSVDLVATGSTSVWSGGAFASLTSVAVFILRNSAVVGCRARVLDPNVVQPDQADVSAHGGCFRILYASVLTLTGCEVADGSTEADGGLFYLTHWGELHVFSSHLTGGTGDYGGLAYLEKLAKVYVTDSLLEDFAAQGGGAFHATAGSAQIHCTSTVVRRVSAMGGEGGFVSMAIGNAANGTTLVLSDVVVEDASAFGGAGVVRVLGSNSPNVTIERCRVVRATAEWASAFLFYDAVVANLTDIVVEDSRSGTDGTIAAAEHSTVVVRGLRVRRSTSDTGLAIFAGGNAHVDAADVEVTDGAVGIAVFRLMGDTVAMLSNVTVANVVGDTAVVLYAADSVVVTMEHVRVENATSTGMMFYHTVHARVQLSGVTVLRSAATLFAVYDTTHSRVDGLVIRDNAPTINPGIGFAAGESVLELLDVDVANVRVQRNSPGGFALHEYCSVTIDGARFSNVTASSLGGLAYIVDESQLTVNDVVVDGVRSTRGDGGVFLVSASCVLDVSNSRFTNAWAARAGGFLALQDSAQATLTNVEVSGLRADGAMGGAFVSVRATDRVLGDVVLPAQLTLRNCRVSDAVSAGDGGCLSVLSSATLELSNSTFADCRVDDTSARWGSGGFLFAGEGVSPAEWQLDGIRVTGARAPFGAVVSTTRPMERKGIVSADCQSLYSSGVPFSTVVAALNVTPIAIDAEPGARLPPIRVLSVDAYGEATRVSPLRILAVRLIVNSGRNGTHPLDVVGSTEGTFTGDALVFSDVFVYGTPGVYTLRLQPSNMSVLYNESDPADAPLFAARITLTVADCSQGKWPVIDSSFAPPRVSCLLPRCDPDCQHGQCTPVRFSNGSIASVFTCKCVFGWTGRGCEVPLLYILIAIGLFFVFFVVTLAFARYSGLLCAFLRKSYAEWRRKEERKRTLYVVKQLSSKVTDVVGIVTDTEAFLVLLGRPPERQHGVMAVYTAFFVIGTFLVALALVATSARIAYTLAIATDPSAADAGRHLRRKLFATGTVLLVAVFKNIPFIVLNVYLTQMDSRECIPVSGAFSLSLTWSAFSVGMKMPLWGKLFRHLNAYFKLDDDASKRASKRTCWSTLTRPFRRTGMTSVNRPGLGRSESEGAFMASNPLRDDSVFNASTAGLVEMSEMRVAVHPDVDDEDV